MSNRFHWCSDTPYTTKVYVPWKFIAESAIYLISHNLLFKHETGTEITIEYHAENKPFLQRDDWSDSARAIRKSRSDAQKVARDKDLDRLFAEMEIYLPSKNSDEVKRKVEMMWYSPGMPGTFACKEHFEENVDKE